ncbi:hypothetical protein CROQUDRAFT_39196 [Cronartium quercuum f. sp. fusiforme G11]|uniref:Uncharacterized protein n=1 Tax=Cronartium quercuum f. sp. fusiforme G11 TaxID=708437 RepID=A0A9P6TEY9_9BASI|nr:hypothetical protein CROQUDRAFT_39196 [Cronartium quercuum f. sp. fusiforme G11]
MNIDHQQFEITSPNIKIIITGTLSSTVRQCLVEPLLKNTTPIDSLNTNPHLTGLLPTCITASFLGGSINGIFRGRHTILKSSITTTLFSFTIQMMYNEINLSRIKLISSSNKTNSIKDQKESIWENWIPLKRITDEEWKEKLIKNIKLIENQQNQNLIEIKKLEQHLQNNNVNSNK